MQDPRDNAFEAPLQGWSFEENSRRKGGNIERPVFCGFNQAKNIQPPVFFGFNKFCIFITGGYLSVFKELLLAL